jgi:aldehyde dehydrogenase (NAD+)
MVRDERVDHVGFTGSSAVGQRIMGICAERIARVSLELGGKSAAIVLDDANLDEALPFLVRGGSRNSGQVCVALTRLLVPTSRREEITQALVQVFTNLKIGDALDPTTDFGPVAVERTRARCESFVASAVREGATVACGGKRPADLARGWYFEPTLLVDVDNSMTVAQEEVFGPIFTLLTYDTIDEAIAIANDSPYGLTAAMFTNDAELALRVGRELNVGSFTVNSTGGVLGQPFGGYKRSGIGREMGREGFLEWTQTKVLKTQASGNYLA